MDAFTNNDKSDIEIYYERKEQQSLAGTLLQLGV
jgi:hypothetical protein